MFDHFKSLARREALAAFHSTEVGTVPLAALPARYPDQ
jgi:hypothetical protein